MKKNYYTLVEYNVDDMSINDCHGIFYGTDKAIKSYLKEFKKAMRSKTMQYRMILQPPVIRIK